MVQEIVRRAMEGGRRFLWHGPPARGRHRLWRRCHGLGIGSKLSARRVLVAVALSLSVTAGCHTPHRSNDAPESPRLEPPDTTPMMTPAQLSRAFRAAYGEGIRLVGQGQYGLALGAFEKAAALKPDAVDALFNLGACYEAIGDPLRAINVYRRVLERTPNDPDCYANLGTSFIKMYYREKSPVWRKMARQAWRRSLELNPRQPNIRAFLATSDSLD